ncbi:hypothetical protein T492DRAFT_972541 [Pavlovales sp. CCMP2436]|nr:hypothetical protein T492DRAFT_972541 [Pavlovales sp. CCMP2436]
MASPRRTAPTAASPDEEESVKLRGRDVVSGMRVVVWYEQEDGKVEYHGTITRLSTAQGVRIWFDGHSYTEQEWVNNEDEWRFEDDLEPVLPAESTALAAVPDEEDEEAACEFQKVTVKLGKLTQVVPKAGGKAKRKRAADAVALQLVPEKDAAAAGGAGRDGSSLHRPMIVYRINAGGITASENDGAETNMPHLKAPRRAPASLLAKYGACSISGGAALYRDPLTGTRFSSVAAFKALRARHAEEMAKTAAPAGGASKGAAGAAGGANKGAARGARAAAK